MSVIGKSFPDDHRGILSAALSLAVISYLVFGTGMFSDDYALVLMLRGRTPGEMIWPAASSLATPLTHLTHAWFYYLIQDGPTYYYDCIKIIYLFLSLLMMRQFFSLWLHPQKALIIAGLFIFYPIHDAVTYWFIGQYLLLSFAFCALSFYLLQRGRTVAAFVFGILGSFISYGSPAVAFGLALIFVMRRDWRRTFLFVLPNLIYVAYYLQVTVYLGKGVSRVPGSLNLVSLWKQFILQIATFIDAAVGPSYWLKMALAFGQITFVSALVACLVIFAIASQREDQDNRNAAPTELVWGAAGVTLAAFGMFAITGLYPQIAFNLGDRVTIFGNLLMVSVIAALPLRRLPLLALVGIYVFAIFGVSDHWKAWQQQQQVVIQNIADNPDLKSLPADSTLYVTGNQYSDYGGISHIEFLSENFMAQTVFAVAMHSAPHYRIYAFNRRYRAEGGFLIDRKYDDKRPVGASIAVYNSTTDRVLELPAAEINAFIDQLPVERRSWVQFLDDGPVRRAILYLMPRLAYAF